MNTSATPSQIRIIRLSLLSGVLLFGVVAAFLASDLPQGLVLNGPGPLAGPVALLVIAAAGTVMFVRRRLEPISNLDQRLRYLLVAHGLCEAAALLGAVHLMISGALLPYIAGATVFAFSFVLLPIKRGRL